MQKILPEIKIKYNLLLDPIFIEYCKHYPYLGWEKWIPPTEEEILKRVKNYKIEWKKYEKKILGGLTDLLGLSFKEYSIEVHIVSGTPRAISSPLIIKSGFTKEEFINVLTHELIHRLFTINALKKKNFLNNPEYKQETEITKTHIIVHAILKYVYLDILNEPKRLNKNIESAKKHHTNEYQKSWEIVEKEGYKKIIFDFKKKLKKAEVI